MRAPPDGLAPGLCSLFARQADDLHGATVILDGEVDRTALAKQAGDFGVALAERHRGHLLRFLVGLGDRCTGQVAVLVAVLVGARRDRDRKSTRLNSVTNAHLVCRLLLEKKKITKTDDTHKK